MKQFAFAAAVTLVAATAAAQTPAAGCAGARDLRLVNGRIATMDAKNSVVSEVTIQDGRVRGRRPRRSGRLSPCTQVINLRGRTAVPGLVDNHNHIVLLGIRPGHDTRLETAASIADVQAAIKARAKACRPASSSRRWAVGIRRSSPRSGCRRSRSSMPRLRIIRSSCSRRSPGPPRPTPAGKTFFTGKGIAVSDAGAIAANAPSVAALNALRAIQTLDDQKRGTLDALAYSASVGVTTNVDMGAFITPGLPDIQDSFTFRQPRQRRSLPHVRRHRGAASRAASCRSACGCSS